MSLQTFRCGATPEKYQLSITNVTYDRIAKAKNSGDALLLYLFYAKTAKRQNTDSIYCTTSFVAKGLKMSKYKVIQAKKTLLSLGLIADHNARTPDNRKIAKWYIKVYHLLEGELYSSKTKTLDNQDTRDSTTNASELEDKCLKNYNKNACLGTSFEEDNDLIPF